MCISLYDHVWAGGSEQSLFNLRESISCPENVYESDPKLRSIITLITPARLRLLPTRS